MAYVRDVQRTFLEHEYTVIHSRQLWDSVRDFWWFASAAAGHPPTRSAIVVTPDLVWDFLLSVYRRQGGGGLLRTERLPSPCAKALAATRCILSMETLPPPTRTEYRRRIRCIAFAEEGSVVREPRPPRRASTYTWAEVRALLGACQTPRDRLLMTLLQRVGLRNAALRGLLLRDVLAEEGSPRPVAHALEKGGVLRTFVVDSEIHSALTAYLTEGYPRSLTHALSTWVLFPRCHSDPSVPMTANQLHFWFHTLRTRCDIPRGPHANIHGFRHFLVTVLLETPRNRVAPGRTDTPARPGNSRTWSSGLGTDSGGAWTTRSTDLMGQCVKTTTNYYWHPDIQNVHGRLDFPWQT